MMALGIVLASLCNGLQALVEFLPRGWHEPWILVQQGLGTVGFSLFFVNSQPFLAEATGPGERNHAYSARMALGTLAGFVGSLVGGALPDLVLVPALSVTRRPTSAYAQALWWHLSVCRSYEFGAYVGISDWAEGSHLPLGRPAGVAGFADPTVVQPERLFERVGGTGVLVVEPDFERLRRFRKDRIERGFFWRPLPEER